MNDYYIGAISKASKQQHRENNMFKAKKFTIAVINTSTKEVVSRHRSLAAAMKGLADACGFDNPEMIDL